jgi:hypothetical protein
MKKEECIATNDLHSFRQQESARPPEYGCHAGSAVVGWRRAQSARSSLMSADCFWPGKFNLNA